MKKKNSLLIVCSSIAILTILAGCWIQYANHIRDLQSRIPIEMWRYIDQNFYGSSYFYAWVAVSSFIAIINAVHFMPKKNTRALENWRNRAKALIFIGALLGSSLLMPSKAATDYTIHVLGVADEEFNAYYSPGFSRWASWEIYIYNAFDRFRDVFDLQFELVGWISYDSDDGLECPVMRLQEAINETGFQPGIKIFDGKIIDLLMVFSAQYFDGCNGLSYPDWKAMLLCHSPEYPRTSYLCHEFSHQFYVEHCFSRGCCCMYNHWEFGLNMPADWCEICRNSLNTNGYKDRFFYRDPIGNTGGYWGGGRCSNDLRNIPY